MEILTAKYFKVEVFSGTSGGHRATLTDGLDFQHGINFLLVFHSNYMSKHAVFDVVAWDRQTDGRTDRRTDRSIRIA